MRKKIIVTAIIIASIIILGYVYLGQYLLIQSYNEERLVVGELSLDFTEYITIFYEGDEILIDDKDDVDKIISAFDKNIRGYIYNKYPDGEFAVTKGHPIWMPSLGCVTFIGVDCELEIIISSNSPEIYSFDIGQELEPFEYLRKFGNHKEPFEYFYKNENHDKLRYKIYGIRHSSFYNSQVIDEVLKKYNVDITYYQDI